MSVSRAEALLLELIRRWAPPSGFGTLTLELYWERGQLRRLKRIVGEESVMLVT